MIHRTCILVYYFSEQLSIIIFKKQIGVFLVSFSYLSKLPLFSLALPIPQSNYSSI